MKKYNPQNIDLSKGKRMQHIGYKKGMFLQNDEDGLPKIIELLQNGAEAECTGQSILSNGVQVIELKIYFKPVE